MLLLLVYTQLQLVEACPMCEDEGESGAEPPGHGRFWLCVNI